MLCSHTPFRALDIPSHQYVSIAIASSSPYLLHHSNGKLVPIFSQFKATDPQLYYSCAVGSRNPRRRAFQAVCFKDEVAALNADPFAPKDDASFIVAPETCISCTTFNILAPIYKRVNGEGFRESERRDLWLTRNQKIVDLLLLCNSSIICLQELWLGSEELTRLYEGSLSQSGYISYKLARTSSRGDGLLTAIKGAKLMVLNYEELQFNDCGDRVAQFFHLKTKLACSMRNQNGGAEFLLVNTHLIFPHDFNYCLVRLRQVFKILKFVEQYRNEHQLTAVPVILCGDWNGSKRGRVYKFLRSQGYLSSYDTVHNYSDAESRRWISHKNHRGNICEVDFIWLLSTDTYQKPLLGSWNEAVLGTIKAKLCQVGLKGRKAFQFFQGEGNSDVVTLEEFRQGLQQLGLTESLSDACSEGLTRMEIDRLMQVIDVNGNGVIDFNEFEGLLAEEDTTPASSREVNFSSSIGSLKSVKNLMARSQAGKLLEGRRKHSSFEIKDAFLYPPEAEAGVWPDEYALSDHAALTAIFRLLGNEHNNMYIA